MDNIYEIWVFVRDPRWVVRHFGRVTAGLTWAGLRGRSTGHRQCVCGAPIAMLVSLCTRSARDPTQADCREQSASQPQRRCPGSIWCPNYPPERPLAMSELDRAAPPTFPKDLSSLPPEVIMLGLRYKASPGHLWAHGTLSDWLNPPSLSTDHYPRRRRIYSIKLTPGDSVIAIVYIHTFFGGILG